MKYKCTVCGYPNIDEPPWGPNGDEPTFDICPCCGCEFGYEDCTPKGKEKYRKYWIENGAKWRVPNLKPINWNLMKQLEEIKINLFTVIDYGNNSLYKRLLQLAIREGEILGKDSQYIFDRIGLILIPPPLAPNKYFCTPQNSLTFAKTGGDGTHYGFLNYGGNPNYDSLPVIMTVPMPSSPHNLILGESLYEFLCLGCQYGYFALSEFIYHKEKIISEINNPSSDSMGEEKRKLLALLRKELCLEPWKSGHISSRLEELNKRFLPLLLVNSELKHS